MTHEFRVSLEGVQLKPEQEAQIRDAIQHAALTQFAKLDLAGDQGAAILHLRPGHGTQGIIYRPVDSAVAEKLIGQGG